MRRRSLLAVALTSVGSAMLPACQPQQPCPPAEVDTTTLQGLLRTVSGARVLFAHQSVGRDILAGLAELATEIAVPLRISELLGDELPHDGPGLFHLNIGENGAPEGKVEAFIELLIGPPTYDVALLKLCYVDFDQIDTRRASGLYDCYCTAVATLRAEQPGLRLAHATVPLRADLRSWKTALKRLLGRDQYGDADNAARNNYNAALRHRFGAEPLFDIAAVESTLANGTRSSFKRNGAEVFTLASEYTHDGGHLNERGRRLASAAFINTLAAALSTR